LRGEERSPSDTQPKISARCHRGKKKNEVPDTRTDKPLEHHINIDLFPWLCLKMEPLLNSAADCPCD